MKNNTEIASRSSVEDAEFLTRLNRSASMTDVLMAAPARFLGASLDEVDFPARFVSRIKQENVNTLADLLRVKPDSLKGKNLGARTLEVATESLSKFFVKKIGQKKLVTLRDMMADFGSDLLAREARIWEMRTGLLGERHTLDAIGSRYGLTRERVRQIEAALYAQFEKKYMATRLVKLMATDGMKFAELIRNTGVLLQETDPLPIAALLETLEPKLYLVSVGTEPVISSAPRTELEVTYKQTVSLAERIFRQSEVLMSTDDFVLAMNKTDADELSKQMTLDAIVKDGRWVDGMLISPNKDKVNFAVGSLQASPRPVHLEQLVEDIKQLCGEDTTPEALRSALSFVPAVRSFGYGLVGFSRHVGMSENEIKEIVRFCEGVVMRGKSGFQWNTKDLLARLHTRHPEMTLAHHELNVILQNSEKLAYLGRLTWTLKGEHDTERKFYRDIFTGVLEKAGRPLPEETLVERANKQRGLHLNVHLRNDSQFLEVLPKVWGLTKRDNPFTIAETKKLAKLFDATFHNGQEFNNDYLDKRVNRKGMKASEIMKVIEIEG